MAGLISEVIGGNVDSDLDKLVAKLAAVEKELDVINGKAITIKVDLQGVGTLSELTSLYKQQDEILTKLRSTSVQYVDTYKMATEAIKEHNGHTLKVVSVSNTLADTMVKEAKARRENAKAIIDETKYTELLEKQKEALEKKTEKARQAAEKESNAYLQLRKTYNEQSTALKGLIIQYGEADAAVVKMKADVDKMYTSLLKAEQAVGQHQRQVGQYQNATFALSQLIREAPSFAYSMSTGILGISNNIPILVDEITKLKTANEALRASGQATIPVWKTLLGAFTSPVGIITTLTAVVTIFAARMTMAGNAAKQAAADTDSYEESLKQLDKTLKNTTTTINSQIRNEETTLQRLMSIYKGAADGTELRIKTYNKLQSMYPNILHSLSEEEIKTNKISAAHEAGMKKLSEYSSLKIKTLQGEKALQESIDAAEKGKKELPKKYAALSSREKEVAKMLAGNQYLTDLQIKNYADYSAEDTYATSEIENARAYNKLRLELANTETLIVAQKLIQVENQKALLKLEELPEAKEKKQKKKKDKKDTISDDLEAAKSDYELQLMLNQQKFNNSRDTDMAAQQLKDDNLKANMEYGERYIMIVEDFNNRELLTENEHIKLINEANKILLEGQIKAKEAGDKIEEQRLQKSIEANKKLITYIESLSKQRQELEKINREIDAIQDKAASRKEYAESFAPYLEGFGFNTAFGQQVKQKGLDIEAQREKVDLALEDWANEGAKGRMANPLELLKLQTKAQQEKKNLHQLEFEREEMYNQKMIEGKKELARKTVDLAKTAFDTMQKMQQLQFDAEQKALDNRLQAVQLASQQEMRAIDATTAFQVEKDNKKAEAAARTAAKENEIRQQSNNLAIRKAQADKQAAQAEIISQTAVAIISTIATYSKLGPMGIALAAGISAAIAATGAAQYAAVSATPLPQYAEGTGDHKGGLAVIGDGGEPEFVTTPTGKNFWSKSTSTIVDLPAHSTVTPLSKMQQYAANMVGGDYYSTMTNGGEKNTMTDKRIVEEIQELRTDLVKAMLIEKKINNTVILKQSNNLQRPMY